MSTPKPTLKKSSSASKSTQGQRSILGFFTKSASTPASKVSTSTFEQETASQLTPAPSSDATTPSSPALVQSSFGKDKENGLPSPSSSLDPLKSADGGAEGVGNNAFSSPSRKVDIFSAGSVLL